MSLAQIDPTTRRVPPLGGFSWEFLGIEIKRTFRNTGLIAFTLIFPIGMTLGLALPQRGTAATGLPLDQGGVSAAVPVMISMALYGAMTASTMIGVSVATERSQGWSRQLRLTPLSPLVYILMKTIAGLAMGGVGVLATIVVGTVAGIHAPLGDLVLGGLAAWLSSLMLTALGLAVGYAFPAQNAMRYLGPLLPVLAGLGGMFVPVSVFPPLVQLVAQLSPLWGITAMAQQLSVGMVPDPWTAVSFVVWFAIFAGLAVLMFRRDTRRV